MVSSRRCGPSRLPPAGTSSTRLPFVTPCTHYVHLRVKDDALLRLGTPAGAGGGGNRAGHRSARARRPAPCAIFVGSARADGTWRSLVAHLTGGQGVAGSNPAVPTRRSRSEGVPGSHSGPFSIFGSQSGSHRRATEPANRTTAGSTSRSSRPWLPARRCAGRRRRRDPRWPGNGQARRLPGVKALRGEPTQVCERAFKPRRCPDPNSHEQQRRRALTATIMSNPCQRWRECLTYGTFVL